MPRQGPAFACSRAAGEISCLRSGVAPLLSVLGIAPTRLVELHEQFRAPVERHRLGISDLLFCLLGVALHDWVLALSEQLGVFCRITRAFLDGGGRWFTWFWRRRSPSIRIEIITLFAFLAENLQGYLQHRLPVLKFESHIRYRDS